MTTSYVTFYFILLDEVYGDTLYFKMAAIGMGAIQLIQQLDLGEKFFFCLFFFG